MATRATAYMIMMHEPALREILAAVGAAPLFAKDLRTQGVRSLPGATFAALRNAKCIVRVDRVQGVSCWQLTPEVIEYLQREATP